MSRQGAKYAKRNIYTSIVLSRYLFDTIALDSKNNIEIFGHNTPFAFFGSWREDGVFNGNDFWILSASPLNA